MNRRFRLSPPNWQVPYANLVAHLDGLMLNGKTVDVVVGEPKRNLDQNALMWAMLSDLSRQVRWLVDGEERLLSPEEWKDIMTAGLKRTLKMARGIDGGFVMLGQSTSSMTKGQMSDLIELMSAFGSEREVRWTDGGKFQ